MKRCKDKKDIRAAMKIAGKETSDMEAQVEMAGHNVDIFPSFVSYNMVAPDFRVTSHMLLFLVRTRDAISAFRIMVTNHK